MLAVNNNDVVRKQAILLAKENVRAEPTITKVYWFPHKSEVHLIEVSSNIPPTSSGTVEAFYFNAQPTYALPASGIALIQPGEVRKLKLPKGWGSWDDAEELRPTELKK